MLDSPVIPAGSAIRVVAARRDLGALLLPAFLRRRARVELLARARDDAEIRARAAYCNRVTEAFTPGPAAVPFRPRLLAGKHAYHLDFLEHLRHFEPGLRVRFRFGDNLAPPEEPCFVKARPVDGAADTAILFPLNKLRHFRFVRDPRRFRDKIDRAVWRGTAFQPQRRLLLERYHDHPLCDVGEAGGRVVRTPWTRPVLSIDEQLAYRYVLSVEGNDVATNLKWILSSSSLCLMPRPRNESWFMEGTLVAGRHYVELRDDLADLEDRVLHYSRHPDEAEQIIRNANAHAARFMSAERERLVALLVLDRYFRASGQHAAAV